MAVINEDLCDGLCSIPGHEFSCPAWQDWLDRQSLEDLAEEDVPKPGSDAALGRPCGCFPCICDHDCPIRSAIVDVTEEVQND